MCSSVAHVRKRADSDDVASPCGHGETGEAFAWLT